MFRLSHVNSKTGLPFITTSLLRAWVTIHVCTVLILYTAWFPCAPLQASCTSLSGDKSLLLVTGHLSLILGYLSSDPQALPSCTSLGCSVWFAPPCLTLIQMPPLLTSTVIHLCLHKNWASSFVAVGDCFGVVLQRLSMLRYDVVVSQVIHLAVVLSNEHLVCKMWISS